MHNNVNILNVIELHFRIVSIVSFILYVFYRNFLKIRKNKIYQKYSIMEQPFIVLTDCVGQEFEQSSASEHRDGLPHLKVWVIIHMSDC